jgi:GntR family transcriptional regulator
MFVIDGARKRLLKDERRRFIEKEWPKVLETIDRLGLDTAELLARSKESMEEGEDDE